MAPSPSVNSLSPLPPFPGKPWFWSSVWLTHLHLLPPRCSQTPTHLSAPRATERHHSLRGRGPKGGGGQRRTRGALKTTLEGWRWGIWSLPSRRFWPNFLWPPFLPVSLGFALLSFFHFWNTRHPHWSRILCLRICLLTKMSLSPQNTYSPHFPGHSQTHAEQWKNRVIDFLLLPAAFSFQLFYC